MSQSSLEELNLDSLAKDKLGERLRYEREKQGLTQQDIANSLHLSVETINTLEENRLEDLPGTVYIRGYQRGYCKQLGIDPDTIMRKFGGNAESLVQDSFSMTLNEDTHKMIRVWGSVAVIAVIVTLLAMRWMDSRQSLDSVSTPPTPLSSPVIEEDIMPPIIKQDTNMVPVQRMVSPADSNQDNEMDVVETESMETDTTEEMDADVAEMESMESNTTEEMEADATEMESMESNTTEEMAADATEMETPGVETEPEETRTGAEVALTISTRDECWTKITDGQNQVLVERILPQGYHKTVYGVLPFDIRLGNAAVIRFEVNGTPYDVNPHVSRLGTAFFKISAFDIQ